MIADTLNRADRYTPLHAGLAAAFEFLRRPDTATLAPGRYEIDGERLFVMVQKAPGQQRSNIACEVHRKYIDVQYVVSGTDELCWAPLEEITTVTADYDAVKDAMFFADVPETWLSLEAGAFAIFFPEDAHAAMQGRGDIHKIVVKVAVNW